MLGARLCGADGTLRTSAPRHDSRGMPVDARGALLGSAPTLRFALPCRYTVVDRGVAFGATVALPPLARPARAVTVPGIVRSALGVADGAVPTLRLRYTEVGVPRRGLLGTAREAAGFARPALLRFEAFESLLGTARELVSALRLR